MHQLNQQIKKTTSPKFYCPIPLSFGEGLGVRLKVSVILCLLLFVSCSMVLSAQENPIDSAIVKSKKTEVISGKKYYLHTVEKKQTLYAIAKTYSIDVNEIIINNPEAIDGIKPGVILKIPVENKKEKTKVISKTDSSKYLFYKVEHGATLYSLSKEFAVSIETLRTLNPELQEGLKDGQVIKFPLSAKNTNKKLSKENPNNEVERRVREMDGRKESESDSDSSMLENIKLKDSYNIALFLPFHSEEAALMDVDKIVKGEEQIPAKTKVAIEFYEGVLMAFDSLKKQGFKGTLFVYDIDETDSNRLQTILKKPELKTMDLIIGPLNGSDFMEVAKFAKENKISITSPLSSQNKILLNNTYVSKVIPSVTTHLELMAEFVAEKYAAENIILITNSIKENNLSDTFKKRITEMLQRTSNKDSLLKEVAYNAKGFNGVQNFLSSSKANIIVVPSNNQAFVTDLITKLNAVEDKYKIILFGMQSWNNFDNLDIEYLNRLQLHLPVNSFVDYDNEATKKFIKQYREKYKTDPGTYAYYGFDISYFYLSALKKTGHKFQKSLPSLNNKGIQTSFSFFKVADDSGYENKSVFITGYENYKLIKVN